MNVHCCPTCGHKVATLPKAALMAIEDVPDGEKTILKILANASGPVPRERFITAVYGHRADGGPDVPDQVIRQFINRLRRRLAPFGWTINRPNGGRGMVGHYRLVPTEAVGE